MKWEQWIPPELIPKRRPAGVVAIYKVSGSFKIFKDSFMDLKGGPGFLDTGEELWKFITFYLPKVQRAAGLQLRRECLGFRLHSEKVTGTLDSFTCSDGGFRVPLKHILPDFGCKDALERTSYFKVQYDEASKMHFIELGKPDFEWKKGKGFYPCVKTE